jgi:hypothetical protein
MCSELRRCPISRDVRFASNLILLLGCWCWLPACSDGNKLDRKTALSVLRQAANNKNEITAEAHTQLEWIESTLGTGSDYERLRQRGQSELDFLNHLVDAGVFRKKPDLPVPCLPEPGNICQGRRNLYYNFEAIPSTNVRVMYPGQMLNKWQSMEFAVLVLATAADPNVTGITQEGIEASVQYELGYRPTDLYRRVYPLVRDALAKCPPPPVGFVITTNPPPSYCGHWPSELEIGAKTEKKSAPFKHYDDGWRVVTQ